MDRSKLIREENIVQVDDAQTRIRRWRDKKWQDEDGNPLETKAFFISMDDIERLHHQLSMFGQANMGARAYLAIDNDGQHEVLLVPVVDALPHTRMHGTDRYESAKAGTEGEYESHIYDLTQPCPNMCDQLSPLYTLIPIK